MELQTNPTHQEGEVQLMIVELEERLELASATDECRCCRCNGVQYPEIPETVVL